MDQQTFRDLRVYLGLTQHEYADKLKVHRSTVANIESGWIPLSDTIKMRVLRAFDVDVELLEKIKRYKKLSMQEC